MKSSAGPLAATTLARLAEQLHQRRAAISHVAGAFHDEATEAIETTDISDLLDDDSPAGAAAEDSLMLAVLADEMVVEIDAALERIERGTYGYCEECGNRIPLERLQALPTTTLCVDCKRRHPLRI